MHSNHYKSHQWWRVPLFSAQRGKSLWLAAVLSFVVSLLIPQHVMAATDYKSWYPFKESPTLAYEGGDPFFYWTTVLFNDKGDDEGFYKGDKYGWGIGIHIGVGNQSQSQYKYAGNLCCDDGGYGRGLGNVYNGSWHGGQTWFSLQDWELGGQWTIRYGEGTDDGGNIKWISPHWKVPFELRNTRIKVRLWGTWWYWNKSGSTAVDVEKTVDIPYTFTVRQIEWNDNYVNISPDGTVTVPYKFSGSGNTDGRTHIATSINGKYSSKIGYRNENPSNYNSGTYTFKLSDLGYNMRSQFTIEPYLEFTHFNDLSAGNGTKYYCTLAGQKTFARMPVATIKKAEFSQLGRTVTLTWTADNGNFETGDWGTKWVIYRNGTKIGSVPQSARSFVDTTFPNESDVSYQIYYVWKGWNETTKLDELKSNVVSVNTTRKVPVNNLTAESMNDRIVFTWTSTGYPQGWGNKFNIYVDDETTPIYTVTPTANQATFQWEHRSTDTHTDRQSGITNGIHWTEEQLNACQPHNYRVEGVIDGKVLNTASVERKAVGTGTLFYSLESTKGSYPGQVKLSWHVNSQGNTAAKTYVVERRRAERESEAWTSLSRMTSADEYVFYTDDTPLPGVYYDYRVTVEDKCSDGTIITNSLTDIGFAQTTGTISGRITFGSTGSAVAGADVEVKKTGNSSDDAEQYHAMHFTDKDNAAVTWKYPNTNYAKNKFSTGDYTVQMWIMPEEYPNKWMVRFWGENRGSVGINTDGRMIYCDGKKQYYFDGLVPTLGVYNHVVVTRSGNKVTCYMVDTDEAGNPVLRKNIQTISYPTLDLNGATQFELGYFKGYIDEFRLWTKCLTEAEILENYDHLLVGNESNLETYWTFDEGLQTQFFDYSRDGTVYNQHHGKIGSNVESTTVTPDDLKLKAKTDIDGNYIIRGIPFTGEGTTYAVLPHLGIHEFNPTQQLRYVGNNSLVHNGTDFEDISSFPVSGTVYYANSNYPVEGVNLYVDGQICSRDGEPIVTDGNGHFEISVPIGKHFIKIAKQGHVFMNDGRFPEDANDTGERFPFDNALPDMVFYDQTLVNFTGRVVGGDIEGNKAVGFGLSTNNVGETQLELTPVTSKTIYLNALKDGAGFIANSETLPVASATDAIASTSYRGKNTNADKIYIHTDPQTGEFSAMVPPLEYSITGMKLVTTGNPLISDNLALDLTNPNIELCDTLYDENGSEQALYKYNTVLKHIIHNTPTFTVKQKGRDDGMFGIDNYTITDAFGDLTLDVIKEVNGVKQYAFNGVPLFIKEDYYTFEIEGYEEYTNVDNDAMTLVPLAGTVVTINNALSADQSVYVEDGNIGDNGETEVHAGQLVELKPNQLQLDDNGKATYKWMAGLPNIATPYTRTITMAYEIGGATKTWDGIEGVILGDLPTGNNFLTQGPSKLLMILRDPPGTNSFAEWTTGSSTSTSTLKGTTFTENFETKFQHKFGLSTKTIIGTPGAGNIIEADAKDDLTLGAKLESSGESSTSRTYTTTATQTITTSAEQDYVGDKGDVFVGTSTNIIFGKARNLTLKRQGAGTTAALGVDDIISTGLKLGTMFSYTQNYIENVLFPNFKLLQKKLLTRVDTQAEIDSYVNNSDKVVYLTLLDEDDENYGKAGTYKAFAPSTLTDGEHYEDSVKWVANEISNWIQYLAYNEEAKVKSFADRENYLMGDNLSFDSGTTITNTFETTNSYTNTWEWNVSAGLVAENSFGFEIQGFGIDCTISDETMGGTHEVQEDGTETTTSYSYTLAEDGDDDALSVDVFRYDAFGPIFRTRAGQTCCPYEGEVRTTYYEENGAHPVIMEATMQIEVPHVTVDDPIVSDIPSGGTANYTLRLSNASEIDEDVYYRLLVADETNPDGANILIDGRPVTDSRIIKIPAGQTITKQMQLKQTNLSILDYERIGIVLASQCQYDPTSTWDVITDTAHITAHFVPSSSPVDLALSTTLMNKNTGTNLNLTFSGFDRTYRGLKAFRLQYREQGEARWTQLHEYVVDPDDVTTNNELLPPEGANVTYNLPMASYADGDYLFRVLSVSTYGTDEISRPSNEIALVKDMQSPAPLGQPEPTDGILDIGDEVSVTFNEPFLKGLLSKEINFRVTGVLNGSPISHATALAMQGTETTAQTEGSINLNGKPFSIDAWVNLNSAGTIFSHGASTNKLTVSIDSDNKLVVDIAGNTYTSINTVPMDEWAFMTLNMTDDGKLSASIASDATTTSLFNELEVTPYSGNGPLSVGGGMSAAIHELLLWDEAHDISTALANRSVTKSPSTRHLIGYWKMNEGEGTTIRDYARSRHLTMPAETWYLNNENKAVSLDGNSYMTLFAGELPIAPEDDYALELWMRGDTQSGEAQLLQAGEVGLWVNANGQLQLTGKGAYDETENQASIFNSQSSILDNAWHHVALNVLRQGAAAVYVDGERVLTTNASNVGGMNTDNILVGARRVKFNAGTADDPLYDYAMVRPFNGQVDEVRVWGATMNADLLASNRKVRLTGSEAGLLAYYPFETQETNSYNQTETVGSNADLTGSSHVAQLRLLSGSTGEIAYTDNAPALREKPVETSVSFNYTASDTKVVITIDEEPAKIDGCTLNFTVRDLRDENGNYSEPAVWSAFVNQKDLVWKDASVSCVAKATEGAAFTATIVNNSGTQQLWTLEGMPSWLQASAEYGSTNPLEETTVTFNVSPATPIGKYEETIYLKGNNGIENPLTINVKVKGDEPLWSVNPSDYPESMNTIANLYVLDTMSEDEDDLVGAFIGNECRGVARPEYDRTFDSYFVTMNIYGGLDENDEGESIEFKVYDASSGIIYPVVKSYLYGETTETDITFEANMLVGRYSKPARLAATDEVEQNIDLGKGWTWMSLAVKPDPDDFTVTNVFSKADNKVLSVKNSTVYSEYFGTRWIGDLVNMDNREMYVVETSDALTLCVTGHRVKSNEEPITVKNGWSWVAFNSLSLMSLEEGLAYMQPQTDEIIKGQHGVAYYENGKWWGNLKQLTPGLGYKIQGKQARTFTYPVNAANGAASRMMQPYSQFAAQSSQFTPVDYRNYPANMVLIAKVVADGEPVEGVELGVFAGEECREAAITDESGMIYITIPGDEPCELTFRVATNGQCSIVNSKSITYETDAVVGTPKAPYIIDLGEATDIADINAILNGNGDVYDLQGRKVQVNDQNHKLRKGVYIVNGQKKVK